MNQSGNPPARAVRASPRYRHAPNEWKPIASIDEQGMIVSASLANPRKLIS